MLEFIIVCPLVFIAGFVDAIAGGGGLISLPAYMIAGVPVHFAIGTNKISSCMGTVISTYRYAKNGYIKLKLAACSAICALIGSSIGAMISLRIHDFYFKILMLFVLPFTAFYVMCKGNIEKNKHMEMKMSYKTYIICMVIAFLIGVYDGFYGPGTGTFLILLLTGIANLHMNTAAGITKVINLSSNVAAVVTFVSNGTIFLLLGLVAGLFSIAGNYIGSGYFTKSGSRIVQPVIITVLTIFFIRIIIDVL